MIRPWSVLLWLCAFAVTAGAEDVVYLRRISGDNAAQPRYVVTRRPPVARNDVISVPAKDVEGLAKVTAEDSSSYIVRTSPSVLPGRYAVRQFTPGVSYMQSMGGGSPYVAPRSPTPKPGQWQPKGTSLDQPAQR